MKTLLSEKQSQNLIDLGIPESSASMDSWQKIRDGRDNPLVFNSDTEARDFLSYDDNIQLLYQYYKINGNEKKI